MDNSTMEEDNPMVTDVTPPSLPAGTAAFSSGTVPPRKRARLTASTNTDDDSSSGSHEDIQASIEQDLPRSPDDEGELPVFNPDLHFTLTNNGVECNLCKCARKPDKKCKVAPSISTFKRHVKEEHNNEFALLPSSTAKNYLEKVTLLNSQRPSIDISGYYCSHPLCDYLAETKSQLARKHTNAKTKCDHTSKPVETLLTRDSFCRLTRKEEAGLDVEVAFRPKSDHLPELLNRFRHEGDTTEHYEYAFFYFAEWCDNSGVEFEDEMRRRISLTYTDTIDESNDVEIVGLCGKIRDWFSSFKAADLVIGQLRADVRGRAINFSGEELDDGSSAHTTFVLNLGVDALIQEAIKIILYMWRMKSLTIRRFVNKATATAKNDILVQQVFFEYLLEAIDTPHRISEIHYYCLVRSMHIKREKLQFRESGNVAKIVASVLHILRAGFLTYARLSRVLTYPQIVDFANKVRAADVAHELSVYIRRCRDAEARKRRSHTSGIDEFGNIYRDGFIFKQEIWSQLIPLTVAKCKVYLESVFKGEDWNHFLEFSVPLDVYRSSQHYIMHFSITNNGKTYNTRDLVLHESDETWNSILQLSAYMELSLFGMGFGVCRGTELNDIMLPTLRFEYGRISYTTSVNKRGNHKGGQMLPIMHTLPIELSRIFLLYRHAVALLHQFAADEHVLPKLGSPNYNLGYAAKELFFPTQSEPSVLTIRHLFIDLHNHFFPKTPKTTSKDNVSRLSGHSAKTNDERYSTDIMGGYIQNLSEFHSGIGGMGIVHSSQPTFSLMEVLGGVPLMFGPGTSFNSTNQEKMVLYSIGHELHVHVSAECGSGKSLSWAGPAAAAWSRGKKLGTIGVVVPFNALVEHHVIATKKLLKRTGVIVESLTRTTDYAIDEFAKLLSGNAETICPDIVIFSLSSFDRFVQRHGNHFDHFRFHRLIFDEIHSILEESYRSDYRALQRIAKFSIPIMTLSGSLCFKFVDPVIRFLIPGDTSYSVIWSDVLIGSFPKGFMVDCRETTNLVTSVVSEIKSRLIKSAEDCVHIICGTVQLAEDIANSLPRTVACLLVTSNTNADDRRRAAGQWHEGQSRVLVSTTCALMGNENPKCRHVLGAGHLFSPSNVVQAAGRLRPPQRTSCGSLQLLYEPSDERTMARYEKQDTDKFQFFLNQGIFQEEHRPTFDRSLSSTSYVNLCQNQEKCFFVHLNELMERPGGAPCRVCHVCRSRPVAQAAVAAQASQNSADSNREKANKVYQLLTETCLHCLKKNCDGEKCLTYGYCFTCGGHPFKDRCPLIQEEKSMAEYIRKLRNQRHFEGCFFCLRLHDSLCGRVNGTCPMAKRLRRMFQSTFAKTTTYGSYKEFMATIMLNPENYYALVASYLPVQHKK